MIIDPKEMQGRPKVLIVLHQETSTPGRVGQELIKYQTGWSATASKDR